MLEGWSEPGIPKVAIVLVAKATDTGWGGAPLAHPGSLQQSCWVSLRLLACSLVDSQDGGRLRKLLGWFGIPPPAPPTACPPAPLSSFTVSLSLCPAHLVFWDKPAGLVWCLGSPHHLILQEEHKFGAGSDPSSEALGKCALL